MTEYKLTPRKTILRISDGASIPMDEDNRDYQEYLSWLKDGGKPLPDDEPVGDVITVDDKLTALWDYVVDGDDSKINDVSVIKIEESK